VCDKRIIGQWGNPVSCFFAPEKWKFPIPSAYNTGRVSFQIRSERMIIMTKGIVKIKKNRAFVEQQNGGGSGFRAVCVSESGKLLDSGGGAVFGAEEEVVF